VDRYPGKKIIDLLRETQPNNPDGIKHLIKNVEIYVEKMDQQDLTKMQNLTKAQATDSGAYRIFRSFERTQNIKRMLQYLCSFVQQLPGEMELSQEAVDPFDQFKSFVGAYADLLKEDDVRRAVIRVQEQLNLVKEGNLWYYEGRIDQSHKEAVKLLKASKKSAIKDYLNLFRAVQVMASFWFQAKNENIENVRRSDLYMFQLAEILLGKPH
jgi:hypothetical protein